MNRFSTRSKSAVVALILFAGLATAASLRQARAAQNDDVLICSIDVVVETRGSTGVAASTETYHRDFFLLEGASYSEDFSTRTRFKFFDARYEKINGDKTVSADWFADVTVFNSVDLATSVTLEDGDKRGKSTGSHILYTSNGSTKTTFTLSVIEN